MPATLWGHCIGIRIAALAIFLTLFTGCYQNHLYVQQEWVDASFLASTHVGTPDPRQKHPPEGQRILIAWRFPTALFLEELQLVLTVLFWDNTEKSLCHPVTKAWGHAAFNFFEKKVLTYRVQVVNQWGEVVEVWEHHFWTEPIEFKNSN